MLQKNKLFTNYGPVLYVSIYPVLGRSSNQKPPTTSYHQKHYKKVTKPMPIIYSLVARGATVLAEFTSTSGNFTTVTRRILDKIPQNDSKMSYVYDRCALGYNFLIGSIIINL